MRKPSKYPQTEARTKCFISRNPCKIPRYICATEVKNKVVDNAIIGNRYNEFPKVNSLRGAFNEIVIIVPAKPVIIPHFFKIAIIAETSSLSFYALASATNLTALTFNPKPVTFFMISTIDCNNHNKPTPVGPKNTANNFVLNIPITMLTI